MKWAIIGNGNVVQTKSGGAFSGDPIRYWGRDDAAAEDIISSNDAVYIATTPNSHLHYARIAAKHKKPTLVEKPMALNVIEAGIMASVFQEAGVPLWAAYYRRCLPRFLKIKEIIDSGLIGEARFCHIQHTLRPEDHPVAPVIKGEPLPWRYKAEVNGGGNFVDMATHHLDLCDYFFGQIDNVVGRARNVGGLYEVEDTVTASFTAGKVPVTGQWCYVAGNNVDRMEIVGSCGYMEFTVFNDYPIKVVMNDGKHWSASYEDIKNPQWVHKPLVDSIVAEMNGGPKCPTNWENGLRAMRVQDKILNASPQD